MAIRCAINGFGRIGRLVLRAGFDQGDIDFVVVNDLTDSKTLAHLLKYDSVHGVWQKQVRFTESSIIVDGKEIKVLSETKPENLPWKDLKIDVVIESTGRFRRPTETKHHLDAGAKWVLLSAPWRGAGEDDLTVVMGVNDQLYDPNKHRMVSVASCTTNCLAPMVKVLNDNFGVIRGEMTTIHAFTNDQRILDLPHSDLRRARSAFLSMIPTSTGAAKAIGLVIPELKGKLSAISIRVPVADGSFVDLSVEVRKKISVDEVNAAFKQASEKPPLKGLLEYCEDEIVSSDIIGNPHSCIFDSKLTDVVEGTFVKVCGWYDNEYGYSSRMVDVMRKIVKG
ncbi:MAG: type I glyceraldehyde-3-phosphate dehydrogenase [bacterium]